MTADEFRELALNLPGAVESSHMNHPDFRAHGKIFATLGYPDKTRGMVKLSPQDQRQFVTQHPEAFTPVKGAWGLQGSTSVCLSTARPEIVAAALDLAWQASAVTTPKKKTTPKKAARRKTSA